MSIPLDCNGYEIRAGYIIRRAHFRHYLRRRMVYIHDVVYASPGGLRVSNCREPKFGPDDGYELEMLLRHWRVEIVEGWYNNADGIARAFFADRKQPIPEKA